MKKEGENETTEIHHREHRGFLCTQYGMKVEACRMKIETTTGKRRRSRFYVICK